MGTSSDPLFADCDRYPSSSSSPLPDFTALAIRESHMVQPATPQRPDMQNPYVANGIRSRARAQPRLPVYDDQRPAFTQPQTPADLMRRHGKVSMPRSRHEEQLSPTYLHPHWGASSPRNTSMGMSRSLPHVPDARPYTDRPQAVGSPSMHSFVAGRSDRGGGGFTQLRTPSMYNRPSLGDTTHIRPAPVLSSHGGRRRGRRGR